MASRSDLVGRCLPDLPRSWERGQKNSEILVLDLVFAHSDVSALQAVDELLSRVLQAGKRVRRPPRLKANVPPRHGQRGGPPEERKQGERLRKTHLPLLDKVQALVDLLQPTLAAEERVRAELARFEEGRNVDGEPAGARMGGLVGGGERERVGLGALSRTGREDKERVEERRIEGKKR